MHPRALSISDYTYTLPEDRIAQRPLKERDGSRLLLMDSGVIEDRGFRELPGLVPDNALLVLNDTRVVNARIVLHRSTGGRIEVLCLEPSEGRPVEQAFEERGSSIWNAFVGNAKRWREGEELLLRHRAGKADQVTLRAEREAAERVRFSWEPSEMSFAELLDRLGHVPLPPYMKRPDAAADKERYNTVFARNEGSVAAPTASLHFSASVLEQLQQQGVRTMELTLHVGAGTFLPVKGDRMADHAMHAEQVRIPLAALEQLAGQLGNGPVIPVGTTALRSLESLYWHGVKLLQGRAGTDLLIDQWEPYDNGAEVLPTPRKALDAVIGQVRSTPGKRLTGSTRLLIAPGYVFRYADALVTNFHQPQSTLLLLVAAFVGPDWRRAYEHALANGYRFLSYGDSSLLWRRGQ